MVEWCKKCKRDYVAYYPNYRYDAVNLCKDCFASEFGGYSYIGDAIVIPFKNIDKVSYPDDSKESKWIADNKDKFEKEFEVGFSVETRCLLFLVPIPKT
jgi:hypothetical protein